MNHRNLSIDLRDDGTLRITEIGDPLDLWEATRRFFNARRPVKTGARGFAYPETTNGEVRQLADVWSRVHGRLWRGDLARARQHRDEWRDARSAIEVATAGADPAATFTRNEELWLRWTKRQAIYLSAVRDMPSRWDMVVDAVKASVQRLPETLATSAEAAADASVTVAGKAGELATAPVRGVFRGLFGPLGTPLLIGAAIAGGIVVVPRLVAGRTRAPVPPPDRSVP